MSEKSNDSLSGRETMSALSPHQTTLFGPQTPLDRAELNAWVIDGRSMPDRVAQYILESIKVRGTTLRAVADQIGIDRRTLGNAIRRRSDPRFNLGPGPRSALAKWLTGETAPAPKVVSIMNHRKRKVGQSRQKQPTDYNERAALVRSDDSDQYGATERIVEGKRASAKIDGLVDPASLEGEPVPARRWIVSDWLPVGEVTQCMGPGGGGKTQMAAQLGAAAATGNKWLGLDVEPCPVFGLFCEDSVEEVHRRLAAVTRFYGVRFCDFRDKFTYACPTDQNTILMEWPDLYGAGEPTDLYKHILQHCRERGARLIIFDALHNLHYGPEMSKSIAVQVVRALRRIAIAIDGAVLLLGHPSQTGLREDTGESGTVSWSNSVRSRWYLKKLEEPNSDGFTRKLLRPKANYAAEDAKTGIGLRYDREAWVWTPRPIAPDAVDRIERGNVEKHFLKMLSEFEGQNRPVSDSSNASNFAPKAFARDPRGRLYSKKQYQDAMHRLFADSAIRMCDYRKHGRAHRKMVRIDGHDGHA